VCELDLFQLLELSFATLKWDNDVPIVDMLALGEYEYTLPNCTDVALK
jgi:hypothetical protein